ncbi:MAG: SRPBCC family protein [Anaerolineales bacterium]|nr:SRPBCC family protein [Anaerolineales bacterium]
MKFTLELPIRKPRAEVWKAFDNVENMKKWQPTLIKFENVSGTPGQPGAVSNLIYAEGKREFVLVEKITYRAEPDQFDGVYENDFADNVIKNFFIATSENETLWKMENEFKFKTFIMKIMGPLMKKNFVIRTEKDMARFKELVESL